MSVINTAIYENDVDDFLNNSNSGGDFTDDDDDIADAGYTITGTATIKN